MRLVIVTPSPMITDGVRVQTTPKFVDGVAAYAAHWPGSITVVGQRASAGTDFNVGSGWWDVEHLPFSLELSDDPVVTTMALAPSVVLAYPKPLTGRLLAAGLRVVLIAENPLAERARYEWVERRSTASMPRILAGAIRHERRIRRMVRQSAGIQCNGFASWEAYRNLSALPLLFFDTRVRRATVQQPPCPTSSPEGPLRLAFSGLFWRHKGPEYAVRLARALTERGVPVTLELFGRGPLEHELRSMAGPETRFSGELPFDPDWLDHVRSQVDLMVLPHVQGDPSGTYLEAAGVGVPTLGFDNAALDGLVRTAGLGWTVPLRDEDALLQRAVSLSQDRAEIDRAGAAGQRFVRKHTFEDEFERRTDHLLRAAAS